MELKLVQKWTPMTASVEIDPSADVTDSETVTKTVAAMVDLQKLCAGRIDMQLTKSEGFLLEVSSAKEVDLIASVMMKEVDGKVHVT